MKAGFVGIPNVAELIGLIFWKDGAYGAATQSVMEAPENVTQEQADACVARIKAQVEAWIAEGLILRPSLIQVAWMDRSAIKDGVERKRTLFTCAVSRKLDSTKAPV